MSHDEWLAIRRTGLGGSDAAAAAGLNPWKSRWELFLEKTGQLPEPEENDRMRWGTLLEPLVADEFVRQSGLRVRRDNKIRRHSDHPWMLANVGRMIVGASEGLEVKTTSAYKADEWDGDDAPIQYVLQCAHYMAVTGASAWWLAVLIGGNTFRFKRMERDERLIRQLVEVEASFWDRVERRDPPAPDGSEATGDLLKALYPTSVPDTTMELPPDASVWVDQFTAAQRDEKEAKERKEEAENNIKSLMGETETAWCGAQKISWKSQSRRLLDTKKLKAEEPSLYDRFVRESVSRTFSIKSPKEGA